MLGLEATSQTTVNLLRTKQCVLNLPSDDMGKAVNALARTTGAEVISESKLQRGYHYEKDKFGAAKLTPQPSEFVHPPRIEQAPVQMEAEMVGQYEVLRGFVLVIEVKVLKTYVVDELRLPNHTNRVNSDAWHPMIMSFQHLYGLRNGRVEESKLAAIDEEHYRIPKEAGPPPSI